MVRAAIIYITSLVFIVGLIILICGIKINPPSMALIVFGSYLITSSIVCAILVTVVEPRIRPKPRVGEKKPLTTIDEEDEDEDENI